jgi:RNA polymerase sigma factor (sigma-70 family)
VISWFHTDELQPRRKYRAPKGYELDDLLTAVGAKRDDEAFTALFDHFRPRVHAQMLRFGLAPFAAADVTQHVMETIWRKAHLFDRRKSAAATWVFRIAQNRCIDVGRRSREHRYADADLFAIPDRAAGSDAGIATAQQEEHIRAALDALPREQFKMVQLAFFRRPVARDYRGANQSADRHGEVAPAARLLAAAPRPPGCRRERSAAVRLAIPPLQALL